MNIEWKPSPATPGYERTVWSVKGPRNIDGETWIFAVRSTEHDAAISLDVAAKRLTGDDLSLHLPFPASVDDARDAGSAQSCKLLKAGHCWCSGHTTSLGADELFRPFRMAPLDVMPEIFWAELERRLATQLPRVLPWKNAKRCDACGGHGVLGAPR